MSITFSVNTNGWFMGGTPHFACIPPPAPVIAPHIEGGSMMGLLPIPMIAPTVLLDAAPAVQVGHDAGASIPHLSAPNVMLAVNILASSCKVNFAKNTVLVANLPAGMWVPGAGMFSLCADPVPLPLGWYVSALYTTVKYGSSWGDLAVGAFRCFVDASVAAVAGSVAGPVSHKLLGRHASKLLIANVPPQAIRNAQKTLVTGVEKAASWLADKKVSSDPNVKRELESLPGVARWIDDSLDAPNPDEVIDAAYDEVLDAIPLLQPDDEESEPQA